MAFMVPVLQNDWNLYGAGSAKSSRRGSQQPQTRSAPQSRRASHAGGLSRQTSSSSSASAATAPGFSMQFSSGGGGGGGGAGRKGSRGDGQRSVTFGPPSPPCAKSRPAEKHNFHTKVVDKLMRVVHRGEKDGARRS